MYSMGLAPICLKVLYVKQSNKPAATNLRLKERNQTVASSMNRSLPFTAFHDVQSFNTFKVVYSNSFIVRPIVLQKS